MVCFIVEKNFLFTFYYCFSPLGRNVLHRLDPFQNKSKGRRFHHQKGACGQNMLKRAKKCAIFGEKKKAGRVLKVFLFV